MEQKYRVTLAYIEEPGISGCGLSTREFEELSASSASDAVKQAFQVLKTTHESAVCDPYNSVVTEIK